MATAMRKTVVRVRETVRIAGKAYYLIGKAALDKAFKGTSFKGTLVLEPTPTRQGRVGARRGTPELPAPISRGNLPAVDAARRNIADNIVGRRQTCGVTQRALAKAAGVRVETLNRIERAKVTADTATIAKIDAALSGQERRSGSRGRKDD